MLTPDGQSAAKIEKVMLLALWANTLQEELFLQQPLKSIKFIFAGIGKPTYPINLHTVKSYLSYWQKINDATIKWYTSSSEVRESSAIDYGDPRGDKEPKALMAKRMSRWYESEIKPENVLFTIGGVGGLHVIFETFNTYYEDTYGYRVITPFPHYSAYSNNPKHFLHPIEVMKEPGYKLTAQAIKASIDEAYLLAERDKKWPKVILICNPSNPLGTIIDEEELKKIADVLREYSDLHIIFDEAYTEMNFVSVPSFLKIAPDLKNRVIIMRSATKALSAAGERMAILLVFNQKLMNEMLNKNITYFIHAPRSAQMAYAQTMANFEENDRFNLAEFYKKKVEYVINRLRAMGAAMPDPLYQVEATFYSLGDFSDMFGLELPESAKRALQRTGKVSTDEELAYYLLFKDYVMITPLSYFGLAKNSGFMRITCSGDEQELQELMDWLEYRLFKARKYKNSTLLRAIKQKLAELKKIDTYIHNIIFDKISIITKKTENCLTLKEQNQALSKILPTIVDFLEIKKCYAPLELEAENME